MTIQIITTNSHTIDQHTIDGQGREQISARMCFSKHQYLYLSSL